MHPIDLQPISLILLDLYVVRSITGCMNKTKRPPDFRLTSTQIGKIAENLVAAQLMMVTGGRLCPFGSLADDDGTDLIIADKLTNCMSRIQVKCRQVDRKNPRGTIQFDVREKTFRKMPDNYMLYVVLDPNDGFIWRAWIIPATELEEIANIKKEKLVITPNPSMASSDRYTKWRCADLREVVNILTNTK